MLCPHKNYIVEAEMSPSGVLVHVECLECQKEFEAEIPDQLFEEVKE